MKPQPQHKFEPGGMTAFSNYIDMVQAVKANPSGINPTEFKCLILPKPVDSKIGSIIIPDTKKESDEFAQTEGRIVAVSHLAFTYATPEEWGDMKPKAGDAVIYGKYAGKRVKGKDGVDYVLVNDKDIVATIEE